MSAPATMLEQISLPAEDPIVICSQELQGVAAGLMGRGLHDEPTLPREATRI